MRIENVTKLTTFEAILHEIGQIWPKSYHLLQKYGVIMSKSPTVSKKYTFGNGASAKSRQLGTKI